MFSTKKGTELKANRKCHFGDLAKQLMNIFFIEMLKLVM